MATTMSKNDTLLIAVSTALKTNTPTLSINDTEPNENVILAFTLTTSKKKARSI